MAKKKAPKSKIIDTSNVPAPPKTITEVRVLSELESRFAEEYIKDLNATQAYIRASGNKEIKVTSASTEGTKTLGKPWVQAKVQALAEARSKRVQIDGDKVLSDLWEISSSDIRKLYDENGCILQPHMWPDDIAMAVKEIQVDELKEFDHETKTMIFLGYTKKIKFWDKIKTRELLGRHKKLFTDKVEHTGQVTLVDLLTAAKKKEQG